MVSRIGVGSGTGEEFTGIGIWPFAISIIAMRLVIDRIGDRTAMLIAFGGHIYLGPWEN